VLIIWILPIQMIRTTVVLFVASAIGFAVLRRQVVAEMPAAAVIGGGEEHEGTTTTSDSVP